MVHYCSKCHTVSIIPNLTTKTWHCPECHQNDEIENEQEILVSVSKKNQVPDINLATLARDPVTSKLNQKCPNCSMPYMANMFPFGKNIIMCERCLSSM